MKKNLHFLIVFAALALAPLLLSACAYDDDQMNDQVIVSDNNPPPVQDVTETIPVLSDPQTQIWIPGYWTLSGGAFSWVSGKVMAKPLPSAAWTRARWMHHTYGWTFEQGHWE